MSDDLQKKPAQTGSPPADGRSTAPRSIPAWADEESSTRTTDTAIPLPSPAQAKQSTRAQLTVISGPSTGRAFSVGEGETVMGRGKEAHVRIDDSGASRAHARIIRPATGAHILEDLGSTNGTFVGGQRIDRVELKSGDRIHIGPNVALSFAILDSQAERINHQLYESSVRDTLTHAHNRRYFVERIAAEIAFARRHSSQLSLIMLDLDHFKSVNDTHGHLAGDAVLREVAALVSRMIRTEDVFARFGGEEFVILVRGIGHVNLGRFANRLRAGVEKLEIAAGGAMLGATISAGFASLGELPADRRVGDALIGLADERLYRAKLAGRNRVCGE